MNIHCSACGAPLPSGARFCPACALPLTAIAMPTPAPVRRPAPLWPWFLGAFLIFWLIAYTSDQITAQHDAAARAAEAAKPARVLSPEEKAADERVDAQVEGEIDREIWNSPDDIKNRISLLSLGERTPARQKVIDHLQRRLKELHTK